ncbi:arylsulfatase [Fulvivirgaceae bacterium BMA10]|uniref:Arylsulfatase n=1 Tax=Splendidivirga corallicola TaxID=3051826 RepID=A0ABT8KHQ8_9BACT|nr:arylsulfatase [Fulvivirgaceae bacterium BMA10]
MKLQFKVIFFLSVFAVSCGLESQTNTTDERPNILLILADDLGWSDIGCYGSEIATPNLDKLAQDGLRFTQFYNTSKCFPSRAILLTGLYAQQNGFHRTHTNPISNGITIGEALKSAGYRTLWSGKHHGIESPIDKGFDRYFGLRDGASNHFNPGHQREGELPPAQKRPDRVWLIDSVTHQPYTPSKDFYTTDEFTKYALNWLEEYKNEKNPFLLYLAYTAPHDPLMAWPEDIEKYKGKYMEGYEAIRKRRFAKQQKLGLISQKHQLSEPAYEDWSAMTKEQQEEEDLKMAVYAAMIDRMDQNIGKIIQKLTDLNELDNTLIIFISDNGGSAEVPNVPGEGEIGTLSRWSSLGKSWANVSNTPYREYKNYSYEGGINSPMIVHWPNKIQGGKIVNNYAGHFLDIMPTLLDIADVTYPSSFNSQSILPLAGQSFFKAFDGVDVAREKPLFWHWRNGKAVRKGNWKIVLHGSDKWDLYNLKDDPTEMKDLSTQHPEIVEELANLYQNWENENAQIVAGQ